VSFVQERSGQVLFREGDPGKQCYVVMSGKVGICVMSAQQEATPRQRDPSVKKTLTQWMEEGCQEEVAASAGKKKYIDEMRDKKDGSTDAKQRKNLKRRFQTSEGFSTFSLESALGDSKGVYGPGTLFGEQAVQNSEPRMASIKCLEDTELLVIDKNSYKTAMKKAIAQVNFFNKHMPSLIMGGYTLRHPCYNFKWKLQKQGHVFLREGIASIEPQVFLILSGAVEFRRFENSSINPAYVLNSRPLLRSSWKAHCARPMTGIAESEHDEEVWFGKSQGYPRRSRELVHDRLGEGQAFCSLPFIPLWGLEPFTVTVASAECQVFCAGRAQIDRICDHHEDRLRALRQQLMPSITRRIEELMLERPPPRPQLPD